MSAPITPNPLALEESVERLREQERFAWFAAQVRMMRGRYTPDYLGDLFRKVPTWPGQREKAIVLLAMDASPEALEVLRSLPVAEHGRAMERLHAIALESATALAR
jgi:hypothetical protein